MPSEISESDLELLSKVAGAVKRGLPERVELADLIQWGYFGLAQAKKSFDPERGIKFRTYASPRIRGAILDALRDYDWAPRLARKRHEAVPALHSLQLLTAPRRNRQRTFDLPDRRPLRETTLDDRDAFERSLAFLHGDMKRVILLNFREDKNLREIGEIMGLSESRISQIRGQAFRILRAKIVAPCKRAAVRRSARRYSRVTLVCDELPGRTFTMKEAAEVAGVSKTSIHFAISNKWRTGSKRLTFRRVDAPQPIPA